MSSQHISAGFSMQGSQTSEAEVAIFKMFWSFPSYGANQIKQKPSVLLIKPSIAAKREREERDMGEELLWLSDRMTRDVTGR